jgi:hypothetical protein
LGRDVYVNAALGALASTHAYDGKPLVKPAEGIRPAGERADTAAAVARRENNEPYSDSAPPFFGNSKSGDAIPFLVQRLAQEGAASFESTGDEDVALPSVRSAAVAAYGAARDSTVEYLSPTPLFDLRV